MKKISMLIMALAILAMTVFAGVPEAFADETEETTYSVFIYSGKEGYFGKKDITLKKITGLKYGESLTVDISGYDLKVKDPDQYYVRGLKIAGHDNDQLSSMQFQSYTFNVKEDMAFSVSYGIAGGMVRYTVNYVDEDGDEIRDPEDFYGMPGDKPVIACKLVSGYIPDNINITRTLTDDESENVFTFTYHKEESDEGSGSGSDGDENGNGGGSGEDSDADDGDADGAGGAAGNGAGAGNGTGIWADNSSVDDSADGSGQDGITDLDDNGTPTTDGNNSGNGAGNSAAGINGGVIAGGLIFLIILIIVIILLRRKKKNEDQ